MKAESKLRAGIIGLGITFFLLLQLLSKYPEFVEKYYSNGLYPILTKIITGIASNFPFSITEVVIWLLIIFGIPSLIYSIKNRRHNLSHVLLNVLIVGAILYMWFYACWGINYFREPLRNKLDLDEVTISMDAFDSTFVELIRKSNDLNLSYPIREVSEINEMIEVSYERTMATLGLPLIPGHKGVKTFIGNWLLNKTITSGFFSPFFHEVHYNKDMLIFEIPFVIAHEKAHQMGYSSEAEANFLAFLVCINSNDLLLRYSGYFNLSSYFLRNVRNDSTREAIYIGLLDEGVKYDRRAVRQRWRSHYSWFSWFSNQSYDLYLRANQVQGGLENYSRVVDLAVRYLERQKEQQANKLKGSTPDLHLP